MRRATIDGKRSASWAWNWWDLAIGKLLTKLALNICILHLFIFSQTYRVDTTLPCWTLCGLPWRSRMFFHFPNQIRTSPWIIAMLSSWQPWEVLKVIFFFSFLFQYCIYSIWKWNRTWKERHIDKSFLFYSFRAWWKSWQFWNRKRLWRFDNRSGTKWRQFGNLAQWEQRGSTVQMDSSWRRPFSCACVRSWYRSKGSG